MLDFFVDASSTVEFTMGHEPSIPEFGTDGSLGPSTSSNTLACKIISLAIR